MMPLQPSEETLLRLRSMLQNVVGRRVGVLGLGVSGRAVALHLARRGARVVGFDRHPTPVGLLGEHGVKVCGDDPAGLRDVDFLCIGPGADPRQRFVTAALELGIPVCGELEVAGRLPARVVSITGTNGKSTTTALVAALLRGMGQKVFVGGNFGEPVVAWLDSGLSVQTAVLELSSFQLETAFSFHTDVAVVLNVTPDHLDRHASLDAYARAKEQLVRCVAPTGVAVLYADDPLVRQMAGACRGRVVWVSAFCAGVDGDGVSLAGETLRGHGAFADLGACQLDHGQLLGPHNRLNAAAAFAAVAALRRPARFTDLLPAYRGFAGLEHRLEKVAEIDGVVYINDSKATNDMAAGVALEAMSRPVVLLAGGRDKGGGYSHSVAAARGRVRRVLAFGEAAEDICAAFRAVQLEVELHTSMESACVRAQAVAVSGDAVLLSPACSSFDAFANYAERGRVFKAWVRAQGGD